MIEISALVKRFGPIRAVDGVSFSVAKGEVLGFLGPNGAGKSTTMKIAAGFLAADAGSARIAGFDVAAEPLEVKRRIGYMPEGAPSYGDMTPAAFLDFIADMRGLGGSGKTSLIAKVVEDVHLADVLDQPIETLSKGYKRRVGLAQALVHDPEILILDEPTDGLDPNQKHEVRTLIRRMASRKAIVISTHLLEEVSAVCSRAVIIDRGRVVADGTPEELAARSALHNAVVLTLRPKPTSEADPVAVLNGLEGVARVESTQGDGAAQDVMGLRVLAANGASIIDSVSKAVRDQGWGVLEMHVERGRLEDVFRDITGGARGAGPAHE